MARVVLNGTNDWKKNRMDTTQLRRAARSAARLARTHYPRFAFGMSVDPGEIPVFTYHDISPETLERDLEYLERNGYRTLSIDEYHDRMSAGTGAGDRVVLLTFDDARRSFRDDAWPVLTRRRARAVLFVPSYWPEGDDGARPEAAPTGFMTWQDIALAEASGLIDVESHAHRHMLVPVGPQLAGFATPALLERHDLFDWPVHHIAGREMLGRPPLGTPVYASRPLLATSRRFEPDEEAARACRNWVSAHGGPEFFARPGALAELRKVHRRAAGHEARSSAAPRPARDDIATELELAVATFERALGRRPRYFAYPWSLGSDASLAMLAELGFTAAFGVALDFRRIRRLRAPLAVYGRYKSDWLQFLPGRGRRKLIDVVPEKLAAFAGTQHLAH